MTALPETQEIVYTFTLQQLWATILAIAGGITAVSGAIAVIVKAVKSLKEPDRKQNERLESHEKEFETINRKLTADKEALDLYHTELVSLKEHQKEQDLLLEEHSRKVSTAEQKLDKSDRNFAIIMQSLLALLDCNQSLLVSIDGVDNNAAEPVQKAKAALESYLING